MSASEIRVDAPREPASTPPKPPRKKQSVIRKEDVILFLLVANIIAVVGLGIRVYRGDKPTVVTVGVTELSREYMSKLATANITPDEARVRTQMFLAVAQDAVRQSAGKKGILVMPRECVLAGAFADVTPDVAKAVTETMERKLKATPAATPALPVLGGANVGPFSR